MQFADILASSVHDMKNSLWMVINTLEGLDASLASDRIGRDRILTLQQEAKRLNSNLIELLTLYKVESGRVSLDVNEWSVSDFLEERVLENRVSAEAMGIDLTWECEADLYAFFDEGLLRGVVNSLIGNGLRYTGSRLQLSAHWGQDGLVIRVEDDGEGFPPEMLVSGSAPDDSLGLSEGRTRLGIHFARMVAELHRNRGRQGHIRIANGGTLGGGRFSIALP